jgi:shikimate kinase
MDVDVPRRQECDPPSVPRPTLVFLYGPPAVGKLTVARAIAERTGFRVLHNHLVNDPAAAVFDYFTEPFFHLVRGLRTALVEAAAAAHVDVVHTFVYAPGDEPVVELVTRAYEEAGGRVLFARLTASREELMRRVGAESRREFRKLRDPTALAELLERFDVFQPVPGRPCVTVDTEELEPPAAADRIVAELGLPRR